MSEEKKPKPYKGATVYIYAAPPPDFSTADFNCAYDLADYRKCPHCVGDIEPMSAGDKCIYCTDSGVCRNPAAKLSALKFAAAEAERMAGKLKAEIEAHKAWE